MIPENAIAKVAFWKTKDPMPKHDFLFLADTQLANTMGIVAASQKQLEEQLKSRLRLEPNAQEIRYFYYGEQNGQDGN